MALQPGTAFPARSLEGGRVNFDELLKSLHRDYLSSLPKKISTIREQIASGNSSDLRESFHKLKGTGRTYGMPEVSELAACIEEICIDFPDRAVVACGHGVELLQDIFDARTKGLDFALDADQRYSAVRKLLQN